MNYTSNKYISGYHRTKNEEIPENIKQVGFIPGKGAAYGVGIYFTYDIMDQMKENMIRVYGPVIVKVKIKLDNFIIFDSDLAIKVYGPKYKANKHIMDVFGVKFPDFDNFAVDVKEKNKYGKFLSSKQAQRFVANKDIKNRLNLVNGLIYSGRHDGRVIVAYNYKNLKVLSYIKAAKPTPDHPKIKEWLKTNMKPVSKVVK